MSLPRDLEPEVNEKLLHKSPYNNSVTNNGHHPHQQQQQQHQQKHNIDHSNGKSNNHNNHNHHHHTNNPKYQNYHHLPHRGQGCSSLNTNSTTMPTTTTNNSTMMGSTTDMKEMTFDTKHDLERQLSRIRCYMKAMAVICIVFFVITIATFSALFVNLRHDLDDHTHQPTVGEQAAFMLQHQSLCVPCDEYRLGPSPEEERMLNTFSLKDTDSGLTCCVDTPQELLDLLKMFVERRFREERAKGLINPWPRSSNGGNEVKHPIAAHLLMTNQNTEGISPIPGRQYTIGRWIHENDMAFTIGTSYQHGRIVIPQDGFYFVYSQISFMEYYSLQQTEAFHSRSGTDSPSLSHYLYRYNIHYHNGGEEKLAQNSITKCWGQSRQYGEYTSYLGAVFYLRNADEIFIKVSNLTMVNTDPKLSYFGLFQI